MTKFLNRESTYPILPILLSRVSFRAFSEERLTEEELMSLFEAARWAPSSYNGQPWRYIYVRRGDKEWDTFFNVLIDWNKKWCVNADTLVLVCSRKNFERNDKPAFTARFDSGASWMSLAVEAHVRNIVTHAMEGFDYQAIRKALQIPNSFEIEAMIAIGRPGNKDSLPPEIKDKETPSTRKSLRNLINRGTFNFT